MLVTKFLQNQKSHTVEVIFKIQRNIVVRQDFRIRNEVENGHSRGIWKLRPLLCYDKVCWVAPTPIDLLKSCAC